MEVSIGEFDLMGGELPSMIAIEAISRLVPGVLGKPQLLKERISKTGGFLGVNANWYWYTGSCGGTFVISGVPSAAMLDINADNSYDRTAARQAPGLQARGLGQIALVADADLGVAPSGRRGLRDLRPRLKLRLLQESAALTYLAFWAVACLIYWAAGRQVLAGTMTLGNRYAEGFAALMRSRAGVTNRLFDIRR